MWHTYIVRCSDDSLYTGITTDLKRRIKEHNGSGMGAKYAKARRPVRLVYAASFPDRSSASKEEACIKKMPRQDKISLIESVEVDQIYSQFLGKIVRVIIDRPLQSKHPKHGFVYQLNYGFIPGTKAPDGEEIDAYVLGSSQPLKKFTGRCIAIIHRLDDQDDKLIVVPDGIDFSDQQIVEATYFQEMFFASILFRSKRKPGPGPGA